jgi:hypothetical protein
MAYEIYREAPVVPHLHDVVEEAWALIPEPVVELERFEFEDLNWFETTTGFYRTRTARLMSVITALDDLERGSPIGERVVTRRYAAGLGQVDPGVRSALSEFLRLFVAA